MGEIEAEAMELIAQRFRRNFAPFMIDIGPSRARETFAEARGDPRPKEWSLRERVLFDTGFVVRHRNQMGTRIAAQVASRGRAFRIVQCVRVDDRSP